MTRPVQSLHLEDEPTDTELVERALKKAGLTCELRRVSDRDAFLAALDREGLDLILADYSLPCFDGLSALAAAHACRPDVPFLFLSGFIGEEVAIESLRQGATDYVFKHNLQRLGPAVARAVYLGILLTHTVLAVVIVPMVIVTVVHALRGFYERHRRLARWTLPLWLYVSITGVVIYLMLYHIYPSTAAAIK